ncbi:galactose oxidase [Auricularia subglabra TFB-10046 SS5]|nr:galactose oxidase [Auricularia subglabra TFB-10046 SS5]
MGKKQKAAAATGKAAAKAAKKAKAAQKVDRREGKKKGKDKDEPRADDQDLEAILDKIKREWEEAHKVSEEVAAGPPSRRANATLTACPTGNYLWMIGGEYFTEDGKAHFYSDVYRYTPEKDEWRLFTSPTCPGPRSAHAVVASPRGHLFLFGGEFSSLYQNNFHHYRDFWQFDVASHMWERIETKVRPSARSGHRMAMWKHYIVLFGGFYDPGIRTHYLNDTWLFDTQEYKWQLLELGPNDRSPSPRSGFSFFATPEGIILHGGYCKEYVKGKRVQGVALDDTWFLKYVMRTPVLVHGNLTRMRRMDVDPKQIKWQKRKRIGYAPSPARSGCTMALWANKQTGVLFGGVTDVKEDEETIESVFYNDMYGYVASGNGRWISLTLRKPKKKAGQGRKKKAAPVQHPQTRPDEEEEDDEEEGEDEGGDDEQPKPKKKEGAAPPPSPAPAPAPAEEDDPDDPNLTLPIARYNAMLAVLRNTLYIYGGIVERGAREYTLDDFYALQLDKLDRFQCLKPCDVVFGVGEESDEEDDDDDDGSGSDEDSDEDDDYDDDAVTVRAASPASTAIEEPEAKAKDEDGPKSEDDLRARATAFMGAARTPDPAQTAEDALSTPLAGETLAVFYARSRTYWAQRALATGASDQRGKMLRRDGFALAEERYREYKPLLDEVERILQEAGLDEDEMRRGAAASGGAGAVEGNRNRR